MVAPTDPRPPRTMLPGRVLEAGQRVGPYEIRSLLGAGGMGEVYRARDTRLERHAAIKVLASKNAPPSLLLAEAQAMAQLSHPNVVTVYDVGTVGELVYVAMELVEGLTLRGWLAAAPRGWREVVHAFISAGRGLAAAHAAGMVHRDFKPDNVLVGHDGRVCVSDFGLAGVRGAETAAISDDDLGADTQKFSVALCGTPAPIIDLAEDLLALHLAADARLALDRAQALRSGGGPDTPSRIHFLLARALWDEHGDRTRAVGLARQARGELATGGPAAQRERAAIDGWMRRHVR